tara:strand:+ start:16352 stop:16708 length:357 start_codon:yes stop_codon:yes gene_type:complete
MNKPKTIFCDIDGTLLHHHGDLHKQMLEAPLLLQGAKEKLVEWDRKGYNIILTTGRKESCRHLTEKQLQETGIFYDQLIMGIGGGARILINDLKPNSDKETAIAINLVRNTGVANVKI